MIRTIWVCSSCNRPLSQNFEEEFELKCTHCSGQAKLSYEGAISWADLDQELDGVMRYAPLLPVSKENLKKVTDQDSPEFRAPISSPKLANILGVASLHLIPAVYGPSGCFKDTEAALVIAKVLDWALTKKLSWHSTGNTARAYRAYAMRAGLESDSYFPLYCIEKFKGAVRDTRNLLIAYDGPFQKVSNIAKERAKEQGTLHLAPLGWKIEGKATLAYAIFEQLPDTNVLVQTIAGGYGALGLQLGIERMRELKLIRESEIRYELFQIDGADTISRLMPLNRDIEQTDLKLPVNPFEPTLQSTNPLSTFNAVRKLVVDSGSAISSVLEKDVQEACEVFSEECKNLDIPIAYEDEKSPFISWAGLLARSKAGALRPTDKIAFIVTGSKHRVGEIPVPDVILGE